MFFDYTSKFKDEVDYFDRDKILEICRKNQPEMLVNDRLSYYKDKGLDFDYYTPEITVMNQSPSVKGHSVVWESCTTMNDHWGYCAGDENFKPVTTLTAGLMGCVSRNGNLLLNVGPMASGALPQGSIQKLEELAEWTRINGEAVSGCGQSAFRPPFGFCYTQKGNVLYLYTLVPPMGDVILPELKDRIESVTLLRTGEPVKIIDFWGFELLGAGEIRIRPQGLKSGDVLKIILKEQK